MTTAAQALQGFYCREQLPPGGTDGARMDWARAFGVPVPIINTRARLAVLPYHDLHHLVTGYRTDEIGEAEIGAWTLGTGGGPLVGHVYDLGTFGLGLFRAPRRTIAAFYRGRQSQHLYDQPLTELMAAEPADLRRRTHTDRAVTEPTPSDRWALVVATAQAALWWLTPAAPLYMAGCMMND